MSIKNVLKLVREDVKDIRSFHHKEVGKKKAYLNLNENPYCFSDKECYNRYPKIRPVDLMKRLAKLYGVKTENIVVGRGSLEILEVLIRTFCKPFRDKIAVSAPTFFMYERTSKINGSGTVQIPMLKKDGYKLNVEKFIKEGKRKNVKLIFIPRPHNPLGHIVSEKDLLKIIKALKNDCCVVVDEAYISFTKEKSFVKYLKKYPNLCVTRTASKFYGLADVRMGAFIGHPEVAEMLNRVLPLYYFPKVCENIIMRALTKENIKKMKAKNDILCKERDRVTAELEKLKYVDKVFKGYGNFILFTSKNAENIIRFLNKKGVLVSDQKSQIENSVRVSVGTAKDNNILLKILKAYK